MRRGPALFFLLFGCGNDNILDVKHNDPTISIESPVDDEQVAEGQPVVFKAGFTFDPGSDVEDLQFYWSSDLLGALTGETTVTAEDASNGDIAFVADGLTLGDHVVSVKMIDDESISATDSVRLSVVENTAPEISFTAPAEGEVFELGLDVEAAALVSDDTEPDLSALELSWTLDGAALSSAPTGADADGAAIVTLSGLALGDHVLSATVEDRVGETASATVSFRVAERDADGDGHDAPEFGGDDCDDADPDIHPGATEICDPEDDDEDCDGLADDLDDAAEGKVSGWPDEDEDGYADDSAWSETCEESQLSDVGGDCVDTDPAVHPGADEICDDGLDNDCDGTSNDCAPAGSYPVDASGTVIFGAADGDRLGTGVALGDMDGDGHDDLLLGADSEATGGADAGAAYLVLGPIAAGTHVVNTISSAAVAGSKSEQAVGTALALGDLTGDGVMELILGVPGYDTTGYSANGAVAIVEGTGAYPTDISGAAMIISGAADTDAAGTAVGSADLDCDGVADLLVGVPKDDTLGTNRGAVAVVFGPSASLGLADADILFVGTDNGEMAGTTLVNIGDGNADGVDDLLIGAPERDGAYSNEGVAWLVYGTCAQTGTIDLTSADASLFGPNSGALAGTALAATGDLDGDGYDDLGVGAPGYNGPTGSSADIGLAAVFSSPLAGGVEVSLASAPLLALGGADQDALGVSLSAGGDVDGDGCPDLLVGATGAAVGGIGGDVGVGGLFYCPDLAAGWSSDLSVADATVEGQAGDDGAGALVEVRGDLDGNGEADPLVTAPSNAGGGSNRGAVAIVPGAGL